MSSQTSILHSGTNINRNRALWLSPRSQPQPPDRLKPAQSSRPSPKRAGQRNGAVLPLPTPSRNTKSIPTTCSTTPPSPVLKRASPTRPAARRQIRLSATRPLRDSSKRPSPKTPSQSSLLSSRTSSPPSMRNPKLPIGPPPKPPLPSRSQCTRHPSRSLKTKSPRQPPKRPKRTRKRSARVKRTASPSPSPCLSLSQWPGVRIPTQLLATGATLQAHKTHLQRRAPLIP